MHCAIMRLNNAHVTNIVRPDPVESATNNNAPLGALLIVAEREGFESDLANYM